MSYATATEADAHRNHELRAGQPAQPGTMGFEAPRHVPFKDSHGDTQRQVLLIAICPRQFPRRVVRLTTPGRSNKTSRYSVVFRLGNVDERAVLVDGDNFFDLASLSGQEDLADPMAAVGAKEILHQFGGELGSASPTGRLADVTLGAPVPRPRNCFGVGLNYSTHVAEANMEAPEVPLVFTKFPSCIVGPNADVELRSGAADYEAEMIVVIGSPGRDIEASRAWDHVLGVTAGQDISDRALQFAASPPHFDLGKSRDTYGPTGPLLVSCDLIPDRDSIPLSCEVNGEPRQADTTASLVFDVPTLIEYISSIITLEPGDLIFTGTPAGVGAAEGKFLKPGDLITTTLEGVGTLSNHCI